MPRSPDSLLRINHIVIKSLVSLLGAVSLLGCSGMPPSEQEVLHTHRSQAETVATDPPNSPEQEELERYSEEYYLTVLSMLLQRYCEREGYTEEQLLVLIKRALEYLEGPSYVQFERSFELGEKADVRNMLVAIMKAASLEKRVLSYAPPLPQSLSFTRQNPNTVAGESLPYDLYLQMVWPYASGPKTIFVPVEDEKLQEYDMFEQHIQVQLSRDSNSTLHYKFAIPYGELNEAGDAFVTGYLLVSFINPSDISNFHYEWHKFPKAGPLQSVKEWLRALVIPSRMGQEETVYKRKNFSPVRIIDGKAYQRMVGEGGVVTWSLVRPPDYYPHTDHNTAPGTNRSLHKWFAGLDDPPIAFQDVLLPEGLSSISVQQFLFKPREPKSSYDITDIGTGIRVNQGDVLPIGASTNEFAAFLYDGTWYTVISIKEVGIPENPNMIVFAIPAAATVPLETSVPQGLTVEVMLSYLWGEGLPADDMRVFNPLD